jgi:hypothetical protein
MEVGCAISDAKLRLGIKHNGDAWVASETVVVERREDDVVHALSGSEIAIESGGAPVSEKPSCKSLPRCPVCVVWIPFNVRGNSAP